MTRTIVAGLAAFAFTGQAWAACPVAPVADADIIACLNDDIEELRSYIDRLEAVLQVDDQGDVHFIGANVYVENGLGTTTTTNGKGNLIVGYGMFSDDAALSGSHNLVVGKGNDFESYGGIVAGEQNRVSAPHALVLGGNENIAAGFAAVALGGIMNEANGDNSLAAGGIGNIANHPFATTAGTHYRSTREVMEAMMGVEDLDQAQEDVFGEDLPAD